MNQLDLLTYQAKPSYPYAAGHRSVDTSVEAAAKVDAKPSKKMICYADITMHLQSCGANGGTTSEIAERLRKYDYSYLQPRLAEMFKLGMVKYEGQRRANAKGNTERVWTL